MATRNDPPRFQTEFAKYAAEAKARGDKETAKRLIGEGKVARKLVQQALAAGYVISVNDGEEWVVKKCADERTIMAALASTDGDTLVIRNPADKTTNNVGAKIAAVQLIYGNAPEELIADYSAPDLDAFAEWLKPVTEYADKLAA